MGLLCFFLFTQSELVLCCVWTVGIETSDNTKIMISILMMLRGK
jgi:hypothetical protein